MFFERLADRNPVIMVFEDVQWADGSLLDFIDYLQNWSRSHPIFVMALARPEAADRHPQWNVPRRGTTTLHLEPLSDDDIRQLLQGLVPGLPDQVERQILDRAEGVPLYAVETVRMLLDRGLLAQEGPAYRLTGPVETLEVPETLHALIAARLDGLDPKERAVLQDAAVVGKTFTKESLGALNGLSTQELEPLLAALVRKEVLFVQADPRSPERGQYGFLQDLIRRVAYETLSKKDRMARHLAAAANLESQWSGEDVEVVEILASHYLDAYQAWPDAPGAAEIKARAANALTRAGQRSLSLAAPLLAQGYFEQALELTGDPGGRAELHEQAGVAAWRAAQSGAASDHYEQAIALFDQEGRPMRSARVATLFADLAFGDGRLEEAGARMQHAFDVLSAGEPDEILAGLAAQWARMLFFTGNADEASERNELALALAEKLQLTEVYAQAINTKGVILSYQGRFEESLLLTREALRIALEHDLHGATLRAYNNVISIGISLERYDEVLPLLDEATEWSRRVGSLVGVVGFQLSKATIFMILGRWDECLSVTEEYEQTSAARDLHYVADLLSPVAIHSRRGELDQARAVLERFSYSEESEEIQARWVYSNYRAVLAAAEGRPQQVLEAAERAISMQDLFGSQALSWDALPEAVEAACSLGDVQRAEELLAQLEGLYPGELTPNMRGQRERLRAKVDIAKGQRGVERGLQKAANEFRAIPTPFWLGVTLLEHAEWLVGQDRGEEANQLTSEAVAIFEGLRALPWLDRAGQLSSQAAAVGVVDP